VSTNGKRFTLSSTTSISIVFILLDIGYSFTSTTTTKRAAKKVTSLHSSKHTTNPENTKSGTIYGLSEENKATFLPLKNKTKKLLYSLNESKKFYIILFNS
jgi:hypothetical protein